MGKAVPGFVGVEKEPNPWDATLPAPVVKVPLDFCSPKVDCPKPKVLAPLFPNRVLVPGGEKDRQRHLSRFFFPSTFAKQFSFGFQYGKGITLTQQYVNS